MISRLLLAFGLLSTFMVINVAIFTPVTSAYQSMDKTLAEDCNPNDPKTCL